MTLLALAGLAGVLLVFFRSNDGVAVEQPAPTEQTHRVDLVQWVFTAVPADGFGVVDGVTTADLALILDGSRTMVIKAGTPGEIDCPDLTAVAACTVAADLLGDGVLWFSIVPGGASATVELPAVMEILDDGRVRLANDWIVRHADKVDRKCAEETTSLSNFIATYGGRATSTFNFETQQVERVTCRPGGGG